MIFHRVDAGRQRWVWCRGPWLRTYREGGYDGYRNLLTWERVPCEELGRRKRCEFRRRHKHKRSAP